VTCCSLGDSRSGVCSILKVRAQSGILASQATRCLASTNSASIMVGGESDGGSDDTVTSGGNTFDGSCKGTGTPNWSGSPSVTVGGQSVGGSDDTVTSGGNGFDGSGDGNSSCNGSGSSVSEGVGSSSALPSCRKGH